MGRRKGREALERQGSWGMKRRGLQGIAEVLAGWRHAPLPLPGVRQITSFRARRCRWWAGPHTP